MLCRLDLYNLKKCVKLVHQSQILRNPVTHTHTQHTHSLMSVLYAKKKRRFADPSNLNAHMRPYITDTCDTNFNPDNSDNSETW